jgi:hypothetical protein
MGTPATTAGIPGQRFPDGPRVRITPGRCSTTPGGTSICPMSTGVTAASMTGPMIAAPVPTLRSGSRIKIISPGTRQVQGLPTMTAQSSAQAGPIGPAGGIPGARGHRERPGGSPASRRHVLSHGGSCHRRTSSRMLPSHGRTNRDRTNRDSMTRTSRMDTGRHRGRRLRRTDRADTSRQPVRRARLSPLPGRRSTRNRITEHVGQPRARLEHAQAPTARPPRSSGLAESWRSARWAPG